MSNHKHAGMYQLQSNAGQAGMGAVSRRRYEPVETYADHAQASCMATRHRIKLIMQGIQQRARQSVKDSKTLARQAIREVGAEVGLRVSRRLFKLAERIEQKAVTIRRR